MIGRRLGYSELIAANGLPNQARRSKRLRKKAARPARRAARPKAGGSKRRVTRIRERVDTKDSAAVADPKINGRRAS